MTRLTILPGGFVLAMTLLAASAGAQTPPAQSPEQVPRIPDLSAMVGARIEVTDEDGSIFRGQLIRASEAGLVLSINRRETDLALNRIREISRWDKDSVLNGILLGAALGLLIPAVITLPIDTGEPGEAQALFIPPGIAIGLAVGWIVDAARHTKVRIFPATPSPVVLTPVVTGRRAGIAASVRF